MKIIINGKIVDVVKAEITIYEDIIEVAGMPYRRDYTVTFRHPDKSGTLFHSTGVPGSAACRPVALREGMIFKIALTGDA